MWLLFQATNSTASMHKLVSFTIVLVDRTGDTSAGTARNGSGATTMRTTELQTTLG